MTALLLLALLAGSASTSNGGDPADAVRAVEGIHLENAWLENVIDPDSVVMDAIDHWLDAMASRDAEHLTEVVSHPFYLAGFGSGACAAPKDDGKTRVELLAMMKCVTSDSFVDGIPTDPAKAGSFKVQQLKKEDFLAQSGPSRKALEARIPSCPFADYDLASFVSKGKTQRMLLLVQDDVTGTICAAVRLPAR